MKKTQELEITPEWFRKSSKPWEWGDRVKSNHQNFEESSVAKYPINLKAEYEYLLKFLDKLGFE